jgi:hypothetical protein
MKKIKKEDFAILNESEMNETRGGKQEREKIGCFMGYKVYACASWEAHCDSEFKYGCDGGFMSCGSGFTLKPIN